MLGFIMADLRRNWAGALAVVLLIALATALGVGVTLQERALRLGSARAAAAFDLVIGAPGSEAQLVLSAVFLQPAPLPLLRSDVLARLRADPGVTFAAPVGFGDFVGAAPIVGTTTDLIRGLGGLTEGRVFRAVDEAVAGADAAFSIGQQVVPLHGETGGSGQAHADTSYRIIGRLTRTGTAWDRALLVPIQAVWRVHGMEAHASRPEAQAHIDGDHDAAPVVFDEERLTDTDIPGVPAIVIKPRTIADAYRLRQSFRTEQSLALFPAEVLTRLYGLLGNVRVILAIVAVGAQSLVGAAVIMLVAVHVFQRRRQIGALRAFGAPRTAVLFTIWLEIVVLIVFGLLLGHALGYNAAVVISAIVSEVGGFALPITFTTSEALTFALMLAIGGLAALVPMLIALAQSPATALRS